jgi:DNA-binding transcriptional LysR family regulator
MLIGQSKFLNDRYTIAYRCPPAPARPGAADALRTRQLLLVAQLGLAAGHLGRAAAALGISQPAATKLLQQAEDALGQPLFTRLARGMQPTPAGEVLIRFAQQLLTDFGAARAEMQALTRGLRGLLRVGSVPGAMPELLAPALVAWQRHHPRVAVTVVVDTSDRMLAQLARGEVDLVLGRLSEGFHDDEYDSRRCWPSRRWWCCGGATRLLAAAEHRHPARAGAPALGAAAAGAARSGGASRPCCTKPASTLRLDITETASTVATTALLAASDRLAVMPASLARHYAALGVLAVLPFDLPLTVPSVHLITRRQRVASPAAASFAGALVAQVEPMAPAAARPMKRSRATRPAA